MVVQTELYDMGWLVVCNRQIPSDIHRTCAAIMIVGCNEHPFT